MRVVSADWVVPVERAPIAAGAVAIGDDGRIAAVGPATELGEGERHDGCVIVPGFVNAHSHIEYAVYAGFGDGLPFVPWIGLHIRRKQALDFDDMVAIATLGAHECLRSGVTTIGDCSFSGAAAVAAAQTGLRAIAYLEVFSSDGPGLVRFHESRARIEHVLSDRVLLGVSPTPRTRARSTSITRARSSACHRRRISPRARPSATGSSTGSATGARSPSSWCRLQGKPVFAYSRPRDC